MEIIDFNGDNQIFKNSDGTCRFRDDYTITVHNCNLVTATKQALIIELLDNDQPLIDFFDSIATVMGAHQSIVSEIIKTRKHIVLVHDQGTKFEKNGRPVMLKLPEHSRLVSLHENFTVTFKAEHFRVTEMNDLAFKLQLEKLSLPERIKMRSDSITLNDFLENQHKIIEPEGTRLHETYFGTTTTSIVIEK